MTERLCAREGCENPLPAGASVRRRFCCGVCQVKAWRAEHPPDPRPPARSVTERNRASRATWYARRVEIDGALWAADERGEVLPSEEHGRVVTYQFKGCRCSECRAAQRHQYHHTKEAKEAESWS